MNFFKRYTDSNLCAGFFMVYFIITIVAVLLADMLSPIFNNTANGFRQCAIGLFITAFGVLMLLCSWKEASLDLKQKQHLAMVVSMSGLLLLFHNILEHDVFTTLRTFVILGLCGYIIISAIHTIYILKYVCTLPVRATVIESISHGKGAMNMNYRFKYGFQYKFKNVEVETHTLSLSNKSKGSATTLYINPMNYKQFKYQYFDETSFMLERVLVIAAVLIYVFIFI